MLDIRLYNPTGVYEGYKKDSEIMDVSNPDDLAAKSVEVIAGKVVKFMLTDKGSDAFSPGYGSVSMHHQQMSPIFFPEFKRQVGEDVANCEKFIKEKELSADVEGEKLLKIDVLKIVYDPVNFPNRVDVYLKVSTTYGNSACVAITTKSYSR